MNGTTEDRQGEQTDRDVAPGSAPSDDHAVAEEAAASAPARSARFRMRKWITTAVGTGIIGTMLAAGIESGAIGDRIAEARHGADYRPDPSSTAELGESVLAAVEGGTSEEFLALFHQPARDACGARDIDGQLKDARAAAAQQRWLARPAVRSEVENGDGSVMVTYGYDQRDGSAVLTELTAVREDGAWRILAYPCPEAYRPDQWREAVLGDVRALHAAIVSATTAGDTMACEETSWNLARMRLQAAPTAELREVTERWVGAARTLADACADQHLGRLFHGVDVTVELEAYAQAAAALERAFEAIARGGTGT